jgi:hypothetical protein
LELAKNRADVSVDRADTPAKRRGDVFDAQPDPEHREDFELARGKRRERTQELPPKARGSGNAFEDHAREGFVVDAENHQVVTPRAVSIRAVSVDSMSIGWLGTPGGTRKPQRPAVGEEDFLAAGAGTLDQRQEMLNKRRRPQARQVDDRRRPRRPRIGSWRQAQILSRTFVAVVQASTQIKHGHAHATRTVKHFPRHRSRDHVDPLKC